jgi:hypothetical protein
MANRIAGRVGPLIQLWLTQVPRHQAMGRGARPCHARLEERLDCAEIVLWDARGQAVHRTPITQGPSDNGTEHSPQGWDSS